MVNLKNAELNTENSWCDVLKVEKERTYRLNFLPQPSPRLITAGEKSDTFTDRLGHFVEVTL